MVIILHCRLASDGLQQSKKAGGQESARGEPESKTNRHTKRKNRHKRQAKSADAITHTAKKTRFFRQLWHLCSLALKPFCASAQCLSGILGRLLSCFVTLLPSGRCMLPVQDNHQYALLACEGDTQKTTRLRCWSRRAPFLKKNKIKILSF